MAARLERCPAHALCLPSFTLPKDWCALRSRLAPRSAPVDLALLRGLLTLFEEVSRDGDAAVLRATRQHDEVHVERVAVSSAEVDTEVVRLPEGLRIAIEQALANIREVNTGLLPVDTERTVRPGTRVGERYRPLESVAVYVPTRKGPLISTALMLIGAARVAGVERIAMVAPPLASGGWEPRTFAAGRLAGATEFYVGNGVALIAALCHGTESVKAVDGIVGPGPRGIASAMAIAGCLGKRTVLGLGPTDCAILADEGASPENLALDLLAEAEHGKDSCSLLVTPSPELAVAVQAELERRIAELPSRRDILGWVLGPRGFGALVVAPWSEAVALINELAPEHLMLVGAGAEARAPLIRNAGEVLLGACSAFAAANYAIGVSAVLPTNGHARTTSAVTALDFLKLSTTARLDRAALRALTPTVLALATAEGMPCHAQSLAARVEV
jgi:histidinol dehydrogenase